jgi:hypothetical protein
MSTKNELTTINTDALVTATGGAGRIAGGPNNIGTFGGYGAHPWLGGLGGLGLGWGGGAAAAAAANAQQTNDMMMCCAMAAANRPRGPYG